MAIGIESNARSSVTKCGREEYVSGLLATERVSGSRLCGEWMTVEVGRAKKPSFNQARWSTKELVAFVACKRTLCAMILYMTHRMLSGRTEGRTTWNGEIGW